MPKLSTQQVADKIWKNSLNTCEYVFGYENAASTITVKCVKHNYYFETKYENVRRDNRAHLICPYCQEEAKEKSRISIECVCSYCNTKFLRTPSQIEKSKSGLLFCCREHKDLAQRIESGVKFQNIRPKHYNPDVIKDYRKAALNNYPHCCAVCKWDEDVDILEVHHIDENHQNNNLDNLIILCPLCHKKLTTHKYRLYGRSIIQPVNL